MAIDTPARLAIVGAGPMGLEAALYARFLGYDVVIYERGDVAANVRQWGGERMDSPFSANRTTLGLAAIQAQDESYRRPGDEEVLTRQEWLDRYLLPLAQTDLIADHLRVNTTVVGVEREQQEFEEWSFRVVSHDVAGEERADIFDGVLECTGAGGNTDWERSGGVTEPHFHILGERSHGEGPEFRMVDGYEQIRRLFAILGERETLDLYASAARLIR
jgi:cation diffusion facilitator CzcD-associated flavoprotein CzcO